MNTTVVHLYVAQLFLPIFWLAHSDHSRAYYFLIIFLRAIRLVHVALRLGAVSKDSRSTLLLLELVAEMST